MVNRNISLVFVDTTNISLEVYKENLKSVNLTGYEAMANSAVNFRSPRTDYFNAMANFYKTYIFEKGQHAILRPFLLHFELAMGGRYRDQSENGKIFVEVGGEFYRSKETVELGPGNNPYTGMQTSKKFQFNEVDSFK